MTYAPTEQEATPLSVDKVAFKVRALPGQTANLFEWRDSADALQVAINSSGGLVPSSVAATGAVSSATGAISTADGLTVGGVIVPQGIEASVVCLLNTACVDQAFFIANRAYEVTAIREVHAVAGNDAGAVSLQVTRDTGTNAPGAGTDLLTDGAGVGLNLKGTANTVQVGTLTATLATRRLAVGDRLSLDFAGTVATLAGMVATVSLKPI